MEWNALVADNVVQAADAPIRSLQRCDISGLRVLGLAGCHWALPRISTLLCLTSLHLFYVTSGNGNPFNLRKLNDFK